MQNPSPELARQMANAIRMLAVDAVEKAKSGHPGAPMGMADIAEVLWNRHLKHNPTNPHWPDRDRFVLSNGHGSMLIYALLHLTGYDLPMSELKNFRQLHSKTAGHPEVGITPGVETTTGPLGQGITNAVGMALAEKLLAQEFNREDEDVSHTIVDHFTYAFLGDGCMMEGISHEACALAGTLRLSKLVAFYDDNGISIDGHVEGWFTDDTPKRFEAYGWHVIPDVDGHNPAAIEAALLEAKKQGALPHGKPTLICCKTVIGMGSPNKAGTHDVHGAALGAAEVAATREELGWTAPPFEIPTEIAHAWNAVERGAAAERAWRERFEAYRTQYPLEAAEFERRMAGDLLPAFAEKLPEVLEAIAAKADAFATRKASQNALDVLSALVPEFFGGSADLTGSNLTNFKGCVKAGRDAWGNHLSYGVREFGMAAIMNGIALHGGYIPYGGTFLTFSDYSRNAIRMAALMKQRVIHVFTHDSIGLGEDGPTHQSVEHVPSLRIIPGLDVWRPADGLETAVAWACAIERKDGPSALCLSRQNLPRLSDVSMVAKIRKGGYVLAEGKNPQAVIVATGSETSLAMEAHAALALEGISTRVVSMPSSNVFDRQSEAYQDMVLPLALPTVAVEAAHPDFWRKYVGRTGVVVGIATFGESAPAKDLYQHFGITAARVSEAVRTLVHRAAHRREQPLPDQIVPGMH
ncbi:transketolase [Hydrogenophaga taeniospiralis CCUG 15921]|uniref:Transketolase n=1 Tax=Hydrogenophaga taeniospiralis CCUG 15921 TaxID=1281780 RepID=A0A9X4NNU1_9BURK|nr:transketolase [Hydrogenophaga taeniospiralis]MDG5974602.1 transketolase [Hydrogenophaga taeniospiralis CCUG 15921]